MCVIILLLLLFRSKCSWRKYYKQCMAQIETVGIQHLQLISIFPLSSIP